MIRSHYHFLTLFRRVSWVLAWATLAAACSPSPALKPDKAHSEPPAASSTTSAKLRSGLDPALDRVQRNLVRCQERLALVRGLVLLLAVLGCDPSKSLLLQHRQRGIDHAGAGAVAAAHPLLQRLDQVVAVRRLGRDHAQQDEAQVAMVEHPAPPAGMMTVPAAVPILRVPREPPLAEMASVVAADSIMRAAMFVMMHMSLSSF